MEKISHEVNVEHVLDNIVIKNKRGIQNDEIVEIAQKLFGKYKQTANNTFVYNTDVYENVLREDQTDSMYRKIVKILIKKYFPFVKKVEKPRKNCNSFRHRFVHLTEVY